MSITRRNEKAELKQLRKLSRSDLLELLLEQTKKNERLESQIKELKTKIEEQRIAAEGAGSIAESARRLGELIEKTEKVIERCSDCKE